MNWKMPRQILYPDIEYIEYHILKVEKWLVALGAACALAFLFSGARPFYQQEQLRYPQAQQFATDVCRMLPNCAQAHLTVWNTGNTSQAWQLIVQVRPKDASLSSADLQSLQQKVRNFARASTFSPIRERANQLVLVMR